MQKVIILDGEHITVDEHIEKLLICNSKNLSVVLDFEGCCFHRAFAVRGADLFEWHPYINMDRCLSLMSLPDGLAVWEGTVRQYFDEDAPFAEIMGGDVRELTFQELLCLWKVKKIFMPPALEYIKDVVVEDPQREQSWDEIFENLGQ